MDNGDWELIPCIKVPEGMEPFPSVWAMCKKRDLVMDQVVKYKEKLHLHGDKQQLF